MKLNQKQKSKLEAWKSRTAERRESIADAFLGMSFDKPLFGTTVFNAALGETEIVWSEGLPNRFNEFAAFQEEPNCLNDVLYIMDPKDRADRQRRLEAYRDPDNMLVYEPCNLGFDSAFVESVDDST